MGILYVIPISLAPSVLLANWFESKLGMVMGIALACPASAAPSSTPSSPGSSPISDGRPPTA